MHMESHSVQSVDDGRESDIAIRTNGLKKVQYRTMLLSQMYVGYRGAGRAEGREVKMNENKQPHSEGRGVSTQIKE